MSSILRILKFSNQRVERVIILQNVYFNKDSIDFETSQFYISI